MPSPVEPDLSPEPVEGRAKRAALVVRQAHRGGLAVVCVALLAGVMPATESWAQAQTAPDAAAKAERREAEKKRRAGKGNLVGHGGPIKALAADAAAGRVVTGSFDYAMMVWDVSGEEPRRLARLDDHWGAINAVALVPGGKLVLAAGDDGKIALWDMETGKLAHRFEGHEAKIVGLAVSPDGKWAASASWDRTARLWDLERHAAGPVLSGHTGPVNAVAFSADGARVYTASTDGTIGAWTRDGAFQRPLHHHGWGINVLARLPGSENLVFGALNGTVAILDAETGNVINELPAHDRPILALAMLDKPGLIATGGGDGVIRVLRAPDGRQIEEYRNPYGPVWALTFVADGTALYYGGLDDFATLWRIAPREPFETIASAFPRRFQVRAEAADQLTAGEVQFARKCSVCHTLAKDGANRAGPTLHEVFGRKIGTLPGYPYSDALKGMSIVWSEETIGKLFELGPDAFTPGSKMPLQKMTDPAQRAALIAYLKLATTAKPAQPSVDEQGPSGPDSLHKGDKP